ncbi:hypothetical protein BDW42DRAFT_36835 [Aspergillus taichungensis]|uniref:Uncharacterized protein n=1 Tax=Aspergillus taichungensis TaxID=482145 RepID=A0A2J5HF46_9EURO|nr:hypothetical protein BDW42DRAFT_36835 [Aspergillus taichungensis]
MDGIGRWRRWKWMPTMMENEGHRKNEIGSSNPLFFFLLLINGSLVWTGLILSYSDASTRGRSQGSRRSRPDGSGVWRIIHEDHLPDRLRGPDPEGIGSIEVQK